MSRASASSSTTKMRIRWRSIKSIAVDKSSGLSPIEDRWRDSSASAVTPELLQQADAEVMAEREKVLGRDGPS